jgi:hypothetical protein
MAGASFLVVGFVVAAVCAMFLEEWLPDNLGMYIVPGIQLPWVYLPGIVLGFYAGRHSWRATLRMA